MKRNSSYLMKVEAIQDNVIILSYEGRDTYRVKAYDFQVERGLSGSDIKVWVRDINPMNGHPYLVQDFEWLLNETYVADNRIGRSAYFQVLGVEQDKNTNRPYLRLKDDYGFSFHRYYIAEDEEYGSRIKLFVKELKTTGNGAFLVLEKPQSQKVELVYSHIEYRPEQEAIAAPKATVGDNKIYPDAHEDFGVEFKSSIVFPANKGEATMPNIDQQTKVIIKSLAGFMNYKGGTLYIGVRDNGDICGIESDFAHLNSGSIGYDEWSGSYPENADGFQQKILNAVDQHLDPIASSLINFEIIKRNGKLVAKINVEKSPVVVFCDEKIIFQRQDIRTKSLKGNAIVHFCISRQGAEQQPMATVGKTQSTGSKAIATRKRDTTTEDSGLRDLALWKRVNFHENGGWSFGDSGDQQTLGKITHSLDIKNYHIKENHLMLMMYDSGNVNAVKITDKDTWKDRGWGKNGFNQEQGLQCVCCSNKMDMVAVIYDEGGASYVKVVDVETIKSYNNLTLNGNMLTPRGAENVRLFHIHHKYHDSLRGLTRKSNNTYKGFDINNPRKAEPCMQALESILAAEYGVEFR